MSNATRERGPSRHLTVGQTLQPAWWFPPSEGGSDQPNRATNPRTRALLRVFLSDPEPTYAEVAAALDMPLGSVGPRRQRCLRLLRASAIAV